MGDLQGERQLKRSQLCPPKCNCAHKHPVCLQVGSARGQETKICKKPAAGGNLLVNRRGASTNKNSNSFNTTTKRGVQKFDFVWCGRT